MFIAQLTAYSLQLAAIPSPNFAAQHCHLIVAIENVHLLYGECAKFDLVPAKGHGVQAVSEGARWLHGGMARCAGKLWGYYQNSSC